MTMSGLNGEESQGNIVRNSSQRDEAQVQQDQNQVQQGGQVAEAGQVTLAGQSGEQGHQGIVNQSLDDINLA